VSEQAIEFLEEWISEKVRPRPAPIDTERQAEILATKCQADAARAGVPIEEIVEEVGDLEDLIVAKLEDASSPDDSVRPNVRPSPSKLDASPLHSANVHLKLRASAG